MNPWAGMQFPQAAPNEHAKIAAEKKLIVTAIKAARSLDPVLADVLVTELNWRSQTRVDGKTIDSAQILAGVVIDLAKRLGWEDTP